VYVLAAAADGGVDEWSSGSDGVQQSQVSSSEPGPSILASNVIGPLLLEVGPTDHPQLSSTQILFTTDRCQLVFIPAVAECP